ncbi:efflux RND transporter periplasmic adaptor subunit [Halodesulfovibrio aestuarii]|uniref:Efflux RND transporter periplasmic adaptor subunit n=1 Tax=Halodesulfovibrio aestuarii TaxID=126333 RepID=A0A8G2C960_9BACT|nr:efflux RND transporter periplasmic adaptor subunit [Halodesulfovibrio aestuarii]SHJ04258.1 RND family efflux transporter, MFP subunit [Halodesulfovibrio aestuarii]
MKDSVYAHITRITLFLALALSVFFVVSDNMLPFTTQATVKTISIDVMPEVNGYIKSIEIQEGEFVKRGDVLVCIDPEQYEIAKEKAEAVLFQRQSEYDEAVQHVNRIKPLAARAFVSEEELDNAMSKEAITRAAVLSARSDVKMASLNLERTKVRANDSGIVTNLTFSKGMYASTTAPIVHLVKGVQWIEGDFAEKGLSALAVNEQVNIVYDAIPNKVFRGRIISIDHAISSGISQRSRLGEIGNETRWIRPQQKIRVRIVPDTFDIHIIAGSRASLMVRGSGGATVVSDAWMRLLSLFRFVY